VRQLSLLQLVHAIGQSGELLPYDYGDHTEGLQPIWQCVPSDPEIQNL